VLTEGTDLPVTGCVLHAKPTKSATLYEQMTGRGLRLFPGKTDCIVIDLVDVARRHSLQTAAVLYGLPPGLKAQGKTLDQLEELYEELQGKGVRMGEMERLTLEDLQARATTFDIWTVPEMGQYGEGLMLRWLRLDEEKFRVTYPVEGGNEAITVGRDVLGRFEVTLAKSTKEGDTWHNGPARQMAAGIVTATDALQLAERFVQQQRQSAARLRSDAAPWRQGKPTEKATRYLKSLVGPAVWQQVVAPKLKTMTAGEVSDMIDLAKARRR
jgi:ATP-dependent helicase IRC3